MSVNTDPIYVLRQKVEELKTELENERDTRKNELGNGALIAINNYNAAYAKELKARLVRVSDSLNGEIDRITAERDEWRKDAERLAKQYWEGYSDKDGCYCLHCGRTTIYNEYDFIRHKIDCPITLHRELVAKYSNSK